jgi:hypothetical protein
VLEEFEFEFQNLQEVALILLHCAPPIQVKIWTWRKAAAVTVVTFERDGHHSQGTFDSSRTMGIVVNQRMDAYAERVSFCAA